MATLATNSTDQFSSEWFDNLEGVWQAMCDGWHVQPCKLGWPSRLPPRLEDAFQFK